MTFCKGFSCLTISTIYSLAQTIKDDNLLRENMYNTTHNDRKRSSRRIAASMTNQGEYLMCSRLMALFACLFFIFYMNRPTYAGDVEDGISAHKKVNFKTSYESSLIEAIRLYKLAVEGNAEAQNNLGLLYENGEGVAQDYKEAVRWFKLAAEQGFAQAQDNLGSRYVDGLGVAQDYKEAVRWFKLAAEQGFAQAQDDLGFMYYRGQGVAQDYKEAIRWYKLAAEQGNAEAQNNLGVYYWKERDDKRAGKWLLLAKLGHNNKASDNYNKLVNATRDGFENELKQIVSAFRVHPVHMSNKENKEWLRKYRAAFKKAKSMNDYAVFIVAYENDDPGNLVPKATDLSVKAGIAEQKHRELKAKKRNQDFRAKLKAGDNTHCGMVIEIRRPLLKIQTMAGDKWFKVDKIFPPGEANCRFVNDVYEEP
jgi:TPR repeat protein